MIFFTRVFIIFGAICACAIFSCAQAKPIQKVIYEGTTSISNILAKEISKIKEGDELDINAVDKAIANFYNQGYYEDIYADFTDGVLTFHFKERPRIVVVKIEGYGSDGERKDMLEKIGLKRGELYDETKIQKAKDTLREELEKDGSYENVIKEEIEYLDAEKSAIALTFNVNQGYDIIIREATYEGSKQLKTNTIEELSANRGRQFAGWMWGRNDGKLHFGELENDSARIRDMYMRHGFLDVKVSPAFLNIDFTDHNATLRFSIDEGKQYKISDIEFDLPIPVVSIKKLKRKTTLKKGDVFNIELMRNDSEIIKELISDQGYAFTRIDPDLKPDPKTGQVKIIYQIVIGQKVKINDVIISGNTRTSDRVIRRELLLGPGDEYSLSKLRRSENALKRLGYFEKIDISERRMSEETMDLLVNVDEARTGELSGGLGYSSYYGLMINASIKERNLFGTGHIGQIYTDWSVLRQTANISLINPRILDSDYSASISAFWNNYFNWDYKEEAKGVTLSLGRNINDLLRVSLDYTISKSQILNFYNDYVRNIYETFFLGRYGNLLPMHGQVKSAIAPTISFDNTDDYYFPKNGVIASAYWEHAGVGGDEKYDKFYGKFSVYKHLKRLIGIDLIARYKAQVGVVKDAGYAPITSKFYMGGVSSVRGYQISSLTPRWNPEQGYNTRSGIRVGGNYIFTNSVELSLGLLDKAKMRVAAFYDYGMIGIDSLNETIRQSWGLSVEWISPMGPVVLLFPFPINLQPGDIRSRFEFMMGTRF